MGMELRHSFTVPVDVDRTWEHFGDLAGLAECFPGAQVTSVEGDSFKGTCKVKLGPIALVYAGSGTFTSREEDKHRFVVEAKGRDKRGNGTAGATVTVEMADAGGSTQVDVHTDLTVTGKPAQFGRGVMQDVSDKLLGQFVDCLEQRLGDQGADQGAAGTEEEAAGATPTPAVEPTVRAAPEPAPEPAPGSSSEPTTQPVRSTDGTGPTHRASAASSEDALDLGSVVLPVLVKNYWKAALAGIVVVAAVAWLVRRLT